MAAARGRLQVSLVLPDDDAPSPQEVRTWVARTLLGWPTSLRLRVLIVVEELVDNLYEHGTAPGLLRLIVTDPFRAISVSVADRGMRPVEHWRIGCGFLLVDAFCERWGVEPSPAGATVWAHLRFTGVAMEDPPCD